MLLDFEKPIFSLEEKLKNLKLKAQKDSTDDTKLKIVIEKLEHEIVILKKKVYDNLTSWQKVQLSRHPDRPYTLDYIKAITNNFLEFHGDRNMGDDPAIVGGIGDIDTQSFIFIGHQKGRTTKERQFRRFGMANPEGYRKALRLMKLAEKFEKPIVIFIDTPGAYPGIEAEEKGQGYTIANNIQSMFGISVPILVYIVGEGASGGALGLGVGDNIAMLENTWYSVISPESCSTILWKTRDYKEEASENLHLTATELLKLKIIDEIIKEPLGGAHKGIDKITEDVKINILKNFQKQKKISSTIRLTKRMEKYCRIGKKFIKQ